MAAKFNVIQTPVIDSELRPSTPDLVMGGRSTAIIGGKNTRNSMYMANFLTSHKPNYGAGDLHSFKFLLNCSGITYGGLPQKPRLDLYRLDTKATVEGNLESATGATTLDTDYLIYSWTPEQNHSNFIEDFGGVRLSPILFNINGAVTQSFTQPFISEEDAALYAQAYTIDEIREFGKRAIDSSGVFYGYFVSFENGYRDEETIFMDGYGVVTVPMNYSNGYYIEPAEDKHPPRGRCYLNTHVEEGGPMLRTESSSATQSEPQEPISATADDTFFFDKFESTRDYIFASGGSNAALTAVNMSAEDLAGFAATIETDSNNALTGTNALKLRTFAREFTDAGQAYNIKDADEATGRQFVRMDALSIPHPTHLDGKLSSGNVTDEAPAIAARMEFVINIDKMAPAYQYRGLSAANSKLQCLTSGSITAGDGGLVLIALDLDHSTYDLDNVSKNLFSDSLQFLLGKVFEDSDGDRYVMVGVKDNDEFIAKRIGHANIPTDNTTLTWRLGDNEANGDDLNYGAQVTSERGLFFILTDETIDDNLSHASALRAHGRRENNSGVNPTGYTTPSMFEFGIIHYAREENAAKFKIVQHGRLFKHGEPLDGSAHVDDDEGEAREEFMVDYNGYNYNNEHTGTGYDDVAANAFGGATSSLTGVPALVDNQPSNGNMGGGVRINEGEYFKLIIEFSPDNDDAKLFIVNMNDENLLGTSNSTIGNYVLLKNLKSTVTNYKEPTAATTKWPNNLYVYLNNTKDFRSANDNTSPEDDYWLEYASDNQKTATDSVVFFDSIKLNNFWPNTSNCTLHDNNSLTKGSINMHNGSLPAYSVTSAFNTESKNSIRDFGYLAIGHHTSTSVSGDNSYVPLFFDGFSAPLTGLDATTSLTAMTIEAMSASTNEPLGYQLTKPSFNSSGNGYAGGSFTLTGDFANEGFIHKGAGVLRWNDAEGGTYPSGTGALTARECILASAKITKIIDKRSILVDAPQKLFIDYGKDTNINQRFMIYEYGKSNDAANKKSGLIIEEIIGNKVTFTTDISTDDGGASSFTSTTDLTNLYVSPIANWIILRYALKEKRSFNTVYGVPVHSSNNDTDFTAGVTYNEFLYNDGFNTNNWNLLLVKDSNIITDVDFGFGTLQDDGVNGGQVSSKWATQGVNTFDMKKSFLMNDEDLGDTLPILIRYRTPTNVTTNITTNNNSTVSNKPLCVTVFEDELPTITNFTIKPNEDNPFNIDFTWECGDEDVWYGFLSVSDNNIDSQYTGSIIHLPLNESGDHDTDAGTITDEVGGITVSAGGGTDARKPHYTIAGLAGNALNFDGSDDHLELGTGSDNCLSTVSDTFSVVAHITHDDADVGVNGEYIIKKEGFEMFIDQNEQINVIFRSDADSGVTLTSTSKVVAGIPMNIIATLDSQLTDGNCKLFINGKLESISGPVLASHGNNDTQTGWVLGTDLHSANGAMLIGNVSAGGSKAFDGNMEEIVFYNEVIYPVNVKSGTFTLEKPLKELNATSFSASRAYSARLFVKDYHNIRGGNAVDVASTPAQSFKKAGFRLDNS